MISVVQGGKGITDVGSDGNAVSKAGRNISEVFIKQGQEISTWREQVQTQTIQGSWQELKQVARAQQKSHFLSTFYTSNADLAKYIMQPKVNLQFAQN